MAGLRLALGVLVALLAFTGLGVALGSVLQAEEPGGEKLYILASTPVLADIIARVAGDRALVESVVEPGLTTVTYELTPRDSARMLEADLFFYVGYGAEAVIGQYAEAVRDGAGIYRVSEIMADVVPGIEANPYFWLDPELVEILAFRVAGILSQVDEEGADYYAERAREFSRELRDLDAWIRGEVSKLPEASRKIVTIRNTLQYYADRYGLEILGYVTPSPGMYEPAASSTVSLLESIMESGIRVVFVEYEEASTTLREVIEALAGESGVEVVEFIYVESLAPQLGVDSYIDMMRANTETIVGSLLAAHPGPPGQRPGSWLLDNPLLKPFKYEFMRRGILTLVFVMAAAALVGSFAVIRGWAIFGDALAHGAVTGLVVAYLLGASFYLGALAAGILVALAVSSVERRTRLRADVIIAATFTTMISIAVAILAFIGGATLALEDILYADVTAVSREMMLRTIGLSAIVIAFTLAIRRYLLVYTVDPLAASSMGVRTGVIHYTLLLILALTIVTAFMAVGAFPAIASLIIPPAAAFLISKRPHEFMLKSVAIAVASAVAGVYASFYINTNAGAAAVIASAIIFAAAVISKREPKH